MHLHARSSLVRLLVNVRSSIDVAREQEGRVALPVSDGLLVLKTLLTPVDGRWEYVPVDQSYSSAEMRSFVYESALGTSDFRLGAQVSLDAAVDRVYRDVMQVYVDRVLPQVALRMREA